MTDPLAALKARFLSRTRADLARLEAIGADAAHGDEVRALVHRLAGTAGTLGFPELSEAAKVIDADLSIRSGGEPPDLSPLLRLLRALPRDPG